MGLASHPREREHTSKELSCTLISDDDGLYDAVELNDRLLLGLKANV